MEAWTIYFNVGMCQNILTISLFENRERRLLRHGFGFDIKIFILQQNIKYVSNLTVIMYHWKLSDME